MSYATRFYQSAAAAGQQRQLSLPSLPYGKYEWSSARRALVPQPGHQVSGVHDVPHANSWFQFRSLLLPVVGACNGLSKKFRRLFFWIGPADGLPVFDLQHAWAELGPDGSLRVCRFELGRSGG